ncbi:hypothetical protein [Shinella sumterensis]|uniref:hypothetical protein n=1 Tax=Shinella sumterensis TaxID=1967501 RepID=UPI003F87E41F
MKIDGNSLSAYALARQQRAPSGDAGILAGLSGGDGNGARNIPTVETSASSMPSGLANALWLNASKLDKMHEESQKVLAEFLDLSKMTAIERLRKELLEEMGLTEDSLSQLPPEERSAINEQIRQAIKERLGVDETAQAGETDGQAAAGTQEAEA